jgi:hypothetical protein
MVTREALRREQPVQVGLVSGRSLLWSPAWDCSVGRVLFDRNSGDFWVLEGRAIDLVQAAEGSSRIDWVDAVLLAGEHGTTLLADLIRAGVIRAWNNAGLPVMATDLADVD